MNTQQEWYKWDEWENTQQEWYKWDEEKYQKQIKNYYSLPPKTDENTVNNVKEEEKNTLMKLLK